MNLSHKGGKFGKILLAAGTASVLAAGSAQASLPNYIGFELQASDRNGAEFNLPDNSFGSQDIGLSDLLAVSNDRHVAFEYNHATGSHFYYGFTEREDAIWYGQNASGGLLTVKDGLGMNTGNLADDGTLLFEYSPFSTGSFDIAGQTLGKGAYTYTPGTPDVVTTVDIGKDDYTTTSLSNDGTKAGLSWSTGGFSGGESIVLFDGLVPNVLASDDAVEPTSPFTFVSTGQSSGDHYVSAVTVGGNKILAKFDVTSDPLAPVYTDLTGPYNTIGNSSFDVSEDGDVLFWAQDATGADVLVFTDDDGASYFELAVEGDGIIGASLGTGDGPGFPPILTADGSLAAFWADNAAGDEAIFVVNTGTGDISQVVSVGDMLMDGNGVLVEIDDLGRYIDINDQGDLLFAAGYGDGNGDGIYLALVPEPASLALLGLGGLALIRRR